LFGVDLSNIRDYNIRFIADKLSSVNIGKAFQKGKTILSISKPQPEIE